MPRKKKFARLLEDADIKRWYDNTARGSRVTADVYLRRLGNFCSHHKITPKKLVEMDQKERYTLLLDFVSMMEKEGYAGSYIQSTIKAVKSWLAHNRIELKGKIKIRGTEDTPTLRDERVPTAKELQQIFLSGNKKARVSSVLVAHSGLRIKTLGNYEGKDGLRVRDLPEMNVEGNLLAGNTSLIAHACMPFSQKRGLDALAVVRGEVAEVLPINVAVAVQVS